MLSPLIAGLGSPHGDDQAGWLVVERLHQLGVSHRDARIVYSPSDLCHIGSATRPLVVCDAGANGLSGGTVEFCEWPAQSLPFSRGGTHDVSLEEALSLGLQLEAVPSIVAIWIINGHDFHPLSKPSADVVTAAEQLAERCWSQWYHA